MTDIFDQLEKESDPKKKTEIVREYIRNSGTQRLDLPMKDGRRADLRKVDLSNIQLVHANLRGAWLANANLQNTEILVAQLQDTVLTDADLCGTKLPGAQLQNAQLICTKLRDADLRGSNLQDASLSGAVLENTKLSGSNLQGVKLGTISTFKYVYIDMIHLGDNGLWSHILDRKGEGKLGEELDKDYIAANRGYLILKNYFTESGEYDAANWAYLKERRMEKHEMFRNWKLVAANPKNWYTTCRLGVKLVIHQLAESICDYGTNLIKVIRSLFVVWIGFGIIYYAFRGVRRDTVITQDFFASILYSLGRMTAVDIESLKPSCEGWYWVVSLETLIGIALVGLLGFILGNTLRRI